MKSPLRKAESRTLDLPVPHFWCQSRADFAQIIFDSVSGNRFCQKCAKIWQRVQKPLTKTCNNIFSRNVGETEQHLFTSLKGNAQYNGTAHTRHQCRKTAVLSCHRFLINSGVEQHILDTNAGKQLS
jgi:hypothetical protein